jgi:hypothetical protein
LQCEVAKQQFVVVAKQGEEAYLCSGETVLLQYILPFNNGFIFIKRFE